MSADDIIAILQEYFGDAWWKDDIFFPEFTQALTKHTPAYNYMAERKRNGASLMDLFNDPVYGLFVNVCDYHPKMSNFLESMRKIGELFET